MTTNTNNQINSGLPDMPVNPINPVQPVSPVAPITSVEPAKSNIDDTLNSNLPWQNRSSNQMDTNNLVQPIPEVANMASVPMDIVQDIPKNVVEPVEPINSENEPVVNLGPELPKVGSPMVETQINEPQTTITNTPEVSSVQPNTNEILQPIEQASSVIKMPEQSTSEESPEAENKRRVKNIIFTIVVLIAGVAALLFGIIVASNAA